MNVVLFLLANSTSYNKYITNTNTVSKQHDTVTLQIKLYINTYTQITYSPHPSIAGTLSKAVKNPISAQNNHTAIYYATF